MELQEIIGGLPYNQKALYTDDGGKEHVVTVTGLDSDMFVSFKPSVKGIIGVEIAGIRLIYRPLSDLTKSIVVDGYNDGKEFVPMKELFKKCAGLRPRKKYTDNDLRAINGDNGISCVGKFKNNENELLVLELYFGGIVDGAITCYRTVRGKPYVACNQLKIFQLLSQWFFWIGDQRRFGKDIIDINKLEEK